VTVVGIARCQCTSSGVRPASWIRSRAVETRNSIRSDAEQAALFAAHPDAKWVAPPRESLHRYATELDLGPPAAYGWLAATAARFGFVMRYSWVQCRVTPWIGEPLIAGRTPS
jgi:hypothetical protein